MAALKRCKNFKRLPVLAPKYNVQVTATRNLNLQEYHSKDLLRKHQVSIQDFRILDTSLDPKPITDFKANEYVIKAQILAGGRGKGHFDNGFKGGVHLTTNPSDILSLAKKMLGHKLITKQTPKDGILVDKVMVAESVNIKRETYLSIIMDRSFNGAAIVASPAGGMDIEQVAEETPHLLKTVPIDIYEGITDKVANEIAEFLQFKGDLKNKCAAEVKKLWNLFQKVSFINKLQMFFLFFLFLYSTLLGYACPKTSFCILYILLYIFLNKQNCLFATLRRGIFCSVLKGTTIEVCCF